MRRFALALLLPAACGDPNAAAEDALAGAARPDDEGRRIPCARGEAELEPVCTVERVASPEGTTLVLRDPSGGFRRLEIAGDGRGVAAADGAEPAKVTIVGDKEIEVALGGDRYRLPATVQGQ